VTLDSVLASDGWNRDTHKMQKDEHGVWSVFVPNAPDGVAIPHGSKVKVRRHDAVSCATAVVAHLVPLPQAVVGYRDAQGQYKREDRIPVWAKRIVEHFHDGQRTFDGTYDDLWTQHS
jgi:hypothetical protein